MNMSDLIAIIRSALPQASFDVDNYGQIIIYTNLMEQDGKIVEMTDTDFEDN